MLQLTKFLVITLMAVLAGCSTLTERETHHKTNASIPEKSQNAKESNTEDYTKEVHQSLSKRHQILPQNQQTIQSEITNHQFSNSKEDMIDQLKKNPATKKLLEENSNNENSNIVYVPEIHSVYQRDVPIKKIITVNGKSNFFP